MNDNADPFANLDPKQAIELRWPLRDYEPSDGSLYLSIRRICGHLWRWDWSKFGAMSPLSPMLAWIHESFYALQQKLIARY